MRVLAIDPGPTQSGWVQWDGNNVVAHGITPTDELLTSLRSANKELHFQHVVIEQIESLGMPVGAPVFETCVNTGRFMEALHERIDCSRMSRQTVKLAVCGRRNANASNIRVAILDRFGGQENAIGKIKSPGKLFGVKSHSFAALALALAYWDTEVAKTVDLSQYAKKTQTTSKDERF